MTIPSMEDLKIFAEELAQLRDEVKVKLHLGSKDAQDEFHAVEEKWEKFSRDAELAKSSDDLKAAAQILGAELKAAYQRIIKAVS